MKNIKLYRNVHCWVSAFADPTIHSLLQPLRDGVRVSEFVIKTKLHSQSGQTKICLHAKEHKTKRTCMRKPESRNIN